MRFTITALIFVSLFSVIAATDGTLSTEVGSAQAIPASQPATRPTTCPLIITIIPPNHTKPMGRIDWTSVEYHRMEPVLKETSWRSLINIATETLNSDLIEETTVIEYTTTEHFLLAVCVKPTWKHIDHKTNTVDPQMFASFAHRCAATYLERRSEPVSNWWFKQSIAYCPRSETVSYVYEFRAVEAVVAGATVGDR